MTFCFHLTRNGPASSVRCLQQALCVSLFFAILPAHAQTLYRSVRDWPAGTGRRAPDYGTRMVVGVATDSKGQVYVFQRTPHPILVFDRAGNYLRTWGHGQFALPHGCRIDPQGNIWLTDVGLHQVFEYASDGRLLATWGVKNTPGNDATHFNQPADVAFGPKGDVYIADGYGNARIVHLDAKGRYRNSWGHPGHAPGAFRLVHSVAVDANGRVYVVDRDNARIQVFTPEGDLLAVWKHVGHPFGLFLTPDQRLFVADGLANTVSIYSLAGKRLAQWGSTGSAAGEMRRAHLLCVDDQGAVYVAEVNGRRVQKFVPQSTSIPTLEKRK
jgi:peptidylamidoglycolate lyase